MNNFELINKFEEAIGQIYDEYELNCLRGVDGMHTLNGRQIFEWHSDVINKIRINSNTKFDYVKNLDDILFCSDELLYFTANLFLYLPFINNPIEDKFDFGNISIYPNYQNLEGKRFNMLADIASQKAYNYWARIGELIFSFFPLQNKSNNNYFHKAIEAIPVEYRESENYLWLKNFKESEYIELNKIRRDIVHTISSDTNFKYRHSAVVTNKEKMYELQAEHENIAPFYQKQISLSILGFEKTLVLLEEIN